MTAPQPMTIVDFLTVLTRRSTVSRRRTNKTRSVVPLTTVPTVAIVGVCEWYAQNNYQTDERTIK